MCKACPQRADCEFYQDWDDCALCKYAVKDEEGNVTGCACPPAQAAGASE
jgi:hypothetical protein